MRRRLPPLISVLVVGLVALGAGTSCGTTDTSSGRLDVVAAFYPLAYLAGEVGGTHVHVTDLTKPGAEPHDLELTPRDVATISDADLVVELATFQPAVDDAIEQADAAHVFDASHSARLTNTFTPIEGGRRDDAEVVDPHFWLDPTRAARVASALARRLAEVDPAHARAYRANAERLVAELDVLDAEYRTGLRNCTQRDLVTSHNAFGYLADRYGFEQVGITGLTPEAEPSPEQLGAVTDFVEQHHVSTIYFETLISPTVARSVADETGATTAVLDPIEALTKASRGDDYLAVMRSNLQTLRRGQECT